MFKKQFSLTLLMVCAPAGHLSTQNFTGPVGINTSPA